MTMNEEAPFELLHSQRGGVRVGACALFEESKNNRDVILDGVQRVPAFITLKFSSATRGRITIC